MRIVLDTNVLVSGLLSPFGEPGEIVRMVAADVLQLCFDVRILTEYRNVLRRAKFNLDQDKVALSLHHIESCGFLVATEPLQYKLQDKGDEPFLEAAIAAKVDYLVTGNIKHFPLKRYKNIMVLTPKAFLERYRKRINAYSDDFYH